MEERTHKIAFLSVCSLVKFLKKDYLKTIVSTQSLDLVQFSRNQSGRGPDWVRILSDILEILIRI